MQRRNEYGKWVGNWPTNNTLNRFDGLPWETREVLVRALRIELTVLEVQIDDFTPDTDPAHTLSALQDLEIATGLLQQLGACPVSSMIPDEDAGYSVPVYCTLDGDHPGDHEWIA